MKNQKGITLIALIITIIVMLILVGVSVTVTLDGGLFKTAQEAATKTKEAVEQESGLKYNYEIAKATGEFTGSYDEYVLQEQYGVEIGAKVNYEEGTVPTSGMEWRVLGVNDKGEIELISTKPTTETVELYGKEDYLNAVTILDTACTPYGQGEGASGVRALTAEDINKLAGYDPATKYTGYGTKYTYKYVTTGGNCCENTVYGIASKNASADISDWYCPCMSEFYTPYWTINSSNVGPEELENTYYYYTVANELTDTTPDNVSWADIITKGEGGSSNVTQWLASRAVDCAESLAYFGVRYVDGGDVNYYYLYFFNDNEYDYGCAVRPVVSLKSNIQLTDANNDGVYEF